MPGVVFAGENGSAFYKPAIGVFSPREADPGSPLKKKHLKNSVSSVSFVSIAFGLLG